MKKPEELTDDDKGLLASYGKVIDFIDKESITPIAQMFLKDYNKETLS